MWIVVFTSDPNMCTTLRHNLYFHRVSLLQLYGQPYGLIFILNQINLWLDMLSQINIWFQGRPYGASFILSQITLWLDGWHYESVYILNQINLWLNNRPYGSISIFSQINVQFFTHNIYVNIGILMKTVHDYLHFNRFLYS